MPDFNSRVNPKIDASLGLLVNVPSYILNKLLLNKDSKQRIEYIILYRNDPDEVKTFIESIGGEFEDLGFNFAIIRVSLDSTYEVARNSNIQYIELPKSLYASDVVSSRASCVPPVISTYNVTGKGVILGFIDSGIDYEHPAFKDAEGNTRIEYIYDLSVDGGKVYDKNQINQAIRSDNPYSIVPEFDLTGHGTHVVGDACGGGNIPTQFKGIAQEASIIMVKGSSGRWVLGSDIMRGIKFLYEKSKELNMPLVINISLSTNDGAHNGSSLLEQYIYTMSNFEKVTIVVAAGNEGDSGHHASGPLQGLQTESINIASDESQIIINLYKPILPDISINIISASGISSNRIQIREGYFQGSVGSDRYDVYVSGPKPFQLNSEIQIILSSITSEYLVGGQWTIEIYTMNTYEGIYSMWLPISEGINPATKFLEADPLNTLGIPATVSNVVAVGSYNSTTNTLSAFSGKGDGNTMSVRPDIVAPGEDVYGPVPGNSYDSKTGTSMAAPQVSGVCALLSEWGIVRGNDPYLFGQRLKYYLVKGANRKINDLIYPNSSWGYGTLCAFDSLKILENVINSILAGRDNREISKNSKVSNTENTQSIIDELRKNKKKYIEYSMFDQIINKRKGKEYEKGKLFYRFP